MRYRLATIQVGFALFIATLFATATGIWLFQDLEQQFIREQYNLVEVFTAQAFLSVYVGDVDLADDIVQSLVGDNILFAQIVKEGQVVAEERKIDLTLPVGNVPVPVTSKRNQYQQIPYLDLTRGLIGRPDSQSDEHVQSYVRLGISLAPLQAIFRQQLWVFALISVGVAGVGTLLGWFIYRDLWSPVARLIQTVKTFGTGDLSAQASVDRDDEFGLLAIEFNAMAKRVAEKNRELERLNAELSKANHAKTEFLTIMSHELRTPLNGILGYADLLARGHYGALPDEQLQPIQALHQSSEHLLNLIENTLSFAKLELGVEKLHLERVELDELIEQVVQQLQPFATGKGISISVQGNENVTFPGDRLKVKQILLNLVQNALQYSSEGAVQIIVAESENAVSLKVKDSGPGFEQQDLVRLSQPFVRGANAQHKATNGVGLGLTIAQRYIKMHQGTLHLEANVRLGTTFAISFPSQDNVAKGEVKDDDQRH